MYAVFSREGYPFVSESWRELCYDFPPNAEHTKLREKLLRLDDVHGHTMFTRFPPQKYSLLDNEEKARDKSVSKSHTANNILLTL